MLRFFDSIVKNHEIEGTRKLNLADLALGDASLLVVAGILKNNKKFAQVDLRKNNFTCIGLKHLALCLSKYNSTVVHLNIGGNAIQIEGSIHLFRCLRGHPSLTSLDLANNDCHKNKIKIGAKGAEELHAMLSDKNCLISNLNLTDNALTNEALNFVISGVQKCKTLISLNLSQNDIATSNANFTSLLQILKNECDLQELNLAENQLQDKHVEELASVFANGKRLCLTSLNLGGNKFRHRGAAALLQTLSNNGKVPIQKLVLNSNFLESNKKPHSDSTFNFFTKALVSFLASSKSLNHLSMGCCNLGKETAFAIGEGLVKNSKLQTLNVRGNLIQLNGIREIVRACYENNNLVLKHIDFSSN